ncbi:translation initiation factor IF-2, chloroplastic-like [Setaria italica]|uniref:translation initiation factor IF-2, chloroplastic-like n=1 Tax=Setaria italica TaxID=4555 RepID=UPI0007199E91|nr:translation initiation factor IF-2, chloroplastic-like [Setaria italica]
MKLLVIGGIAGAAADDEAANGISVEAPTFTDGVPSPVDGAAAVATGTSAEGAISGALGVGEVPEGAAIGEVGRNVNGRRRRRTGGLRKALEGEEGLCAEEGRRNIAQFLKKCWQVIGLNNVPLAGDEFEVVDNLDVARERANERAGTLDIERISAKAGEGKVTLSSIAASVSSAKQAGIDTHGLNVILKVDFQGTIEAIRQAIQVLPQENVSLRFLLQAPGDVSVSDVDLAVASEGIIFGFNVKAPGLVKNYAKKKSVEIRLYKVIYDLIDDLRNAMEGLLEPAEEEVPIGTAKVRAIFSCGSGKVAGCMITTGKVVQDCNVRVLRKGEEVYVGSLDSLRRVKETVKEVGAGLECGIGVDDFDEWEEGDVVEAFNTVKKARTLEEASATVTAALKDAGVQL